VERLAHIGPYHDDIDLEALRLDDGTIEIVVKEPKEERRVRLEVGDRLELHARWQLWEPPFVAVDTTVTLARGAEGVYLGNFEFDIMWGGWLPEQIREELQKIGCEIRLTEEKIERG
jgi:hypothetical protein